MANPQTTSTAAEVKNIYAVVALPPDGVTPRLKKLMQGLRAEFGGPLFETHITVVRPISLTLEDALTKFRSASEGFKAYDTKVDHVATGTFFYQCVPPHKSDPSGGGS
ncbi:cyclic phosphodiesterase-like [Pyrus x bretschneideri]|uniref:cyclic phosphodiesterase-like n=1 Tax=Pyrus x bretschneideri TaxID=225117 RepID=UPI00202F612F|nr:cyclic phosphodiesterase-like [Pyrus x bretschneideri]